MLTIFSKFVRSSKGSGPGLNDDLADKMHTFMEGPATHRESHSKHLPDVTVSASRCKVADSGISSYRMVVVVMKCGWLCCRLAVGQTVAC